MEKKGGKQSECPIALGDHYDVLEEVLKHLDARSLCIAACVCKQWRLICNHDSTWEHLCNRLAPAAATTVSVFTTNQIRSVVVAMGGFRRLYLMCIRPLFERLRPPPGRSPGAGKWTREQEQLSLSLFSIDCYERLGSELGESGSSSPSLSLRFLCKLQCESGGIC
ncbi:F-box protein [Nymphaea thermarum]|nr:F-box protein [Nymphaea thermarum]